MGKIILELDYQSCPCKCYLSKDEKKFLIILGKKETKIEYIDISSGGKIRKIRQAENNYKNGTYIFFNIQNPIKVY